MWKKLTSFLFKEEEIILEEEEHKIEEIKIKPVAPLKEPERKEPERKEPEEPIEETKEFKVVRETKPKKSMMIDLEEKPKTPISHAKEEAFEYKRKNIISPIFGGDDLEEDQVIKPLVKPKPKAKTQVISPMYGSVEEEDDVENVDLDLGLDEILADEPIEEEVQTSLFDYIEEPSSDE